MGACGSRTQPGGSDGGTPDGSAADGGSPGTGPGRFYVVGKDIVDPGGKKFFPVGANLISSSYWSFIASEVGTGYSHIDKVKAWGWNMVRLPEFFYPRFGAQTDFDVLYRYIDAFTAEKIVALVDFQSIEPGTWPNEAQLSAAEAAFRQLAQRYKDNPYLWFELINEPGDPDVDDGITQSTKWLDQHRRLIRAIRDQGAENVILVMGSDWGQDSRTQAVLQKGQDLRGTECNILFSFHVYEMWPLQGSLQTYAQSAHAKGLALLATEAGFHDGTYDEGWNPADVESSVRQYYRDLAPMGVGVLLWHAMSATDDKYGAVVRGDGGTAQQFGHFYLINSDTHPTNLTADGQLHWDLSHNKPELGPFTGSLAASNCASALQ